MVIVQINQTYKIGSTGKIMSDLNDVIKENGHEGYMVAGYALKNSKSNLYCFNKQFVALKTRINFLISRLSGKMGYRQKKETIKAIEWIDSKKPDVIHLHNIHGDWINVELLFEYIKIKNIRVVWTLHDCWAFTGRCSHFEMCKCDKWKYGCYNCSNNRVYPITYFFDFSKTMWLDKKNWFSGVSKMKIITPSFWLANYVRESFLKCYPVSVIHNGIDTNLFTRKQGAFPLKKIILGVASSWTQNKGLNDFLQLDRLIDHDLYEIVLVGLNLRQLRNIPKTIRGVARTNSIEELAQLYSSACVFVNPTYLDNYPTTNLEAIACGTPVVTYKTGGSPESVSLKCGVVLEKGDVKGILNYIQSHACEQPNHEFMIDYAKKNFDKFNVLNEYLREYEF